MQMQVMQMFIQSVGFQWSFFPGNLALTSPSVIGTKVVFPSFWQEKGAVTDATVLHMELMTGHMAAFYIWSKWHVEQMTLFIWVSLSRAPLDPIIISVGDNSDLEYIFRCVFFFWLLSTPLGRWFVGVWRGGFICVCTLQKRRVTMLQPQQPRSPTPSMSNESIVNPIFNVE